MLDLKAWQKSCQDYIAENNEKCETCQAREGCPIRRVAEEPTEEAVLELMFLKGIMGMGPQA